MQESRKFHKAYSRKFKAEDGSFIRILKKTKGLWKRTGLCISGLYPYTYEKEYPNLRSKALP